jgi:predicted TIM-barrel fold metal-dependent hydrolase
MIVDCHTHIHCADRQVSRTEHLVAAGSVDACIVLAAPAATYGTSCPPGRACPPGRDEGSNTVNKELSEYVNTHGEKMFGFALVDPVRDKVGLKNLRSLQEDLNLKGCVLYCCECGFHPTHSRAMCFYESAEELGLPVFFHNAAPLSPDAVLDYAQPFLLDEVARTFGSLKIVIGRMGWPFIDQTLCMVGKHNGVYADLSIQPDNLWQTYNIVVAAREQAVMDKLLFGSGFPFAQPGPCMERLLGLNKFLGDTSLPTVPQGQIRGIIERDSLTLLGIKK